MDMRVRLRPKAEPIDIGTASVGAGAPAQAVAASLIDVLVSDYGALHRSLLRRFRCADLAAECLHEAWLRLATVPILGDIQHPQAYILRMASHLAIDRLRRQRDWVDLDEVEPDLLRDEASLPDAMVEARVSVEALERAMAELPPLHRGVLVALRIDDRTRQDVAHHYGLSLRRVDTLLRQALDHCAQACGEPVHVGVGGTRRRLPRRWRETVQARSMSSSYQHQGRTALAVGQAVHG